MLFLTRISVTDTLAAAIWFNRFSLNAGLYCAAVLSAKKIACRFFFVTAEIIHKRPKSPPSSSLQRGAKRAQIRWFFP